MGDSGMPGRSGSSGNTARGDSWRAKGFLSRLPTYLAGAGMFGALARLALAAEGGRAPGQLPVVSGLLLAAAFLCALAYRRQREGARVAARSEAHLRTVLDHTDNALLALDADRRVAFYNERYVQSFGVPRELLEDGVSLEVLLEWACRTGLYPADRLGALTAARAAALAGVEDPCTIDVPRTDGVVMEARAASLPGGGHLLAFRDVTENRRAQAALRAAMEFSEDLLGSSPIATFVLDAQHLVLHWNPACEELTGVRASEVVGTNLHWRAFYPAKRPCLADLVLEGRESDAAGLYAEWGASELAPRGFRAAGWFEGLGGKRRYIAFDAAPILDRRGRLTAAVETLQDITVLKQAEEELARLGAAVDQTAEAILVTDEAGRAQYVNPAYERLSGATREELLDGRAAAGIPNEAWTVLRKGEAWSGRGGGRREDGSTYQEDVTVSPVRDPSGRIVNYVAIRMDVTQEVELQRRLAQSQRLEALGTLAGGIAHDFNNILTAILGFAELTRDDLPEGTLVRGNLDRVLAAGERARDLVRQILTFSRRSGEDREAVLVVPIVEETLEMLRATLPSNVELRPNLPSREATVIADPTQVHQIVLNLCTNSAQAMGAAGGVLTVSLDEEGAAAPQEDPATRRWVRLTVTDTGPGVAPEIAPHIFEPFFTTKDVGAGTGMGLSVVHGIVQSHGGSVAVESTPGRGASFVVRLPSAPPVWGPHGGGGPATGSSAGRILLVDDEAVLVALGDQILRQLGYDVVALGDSLVALDHFREDPQAFDLVITDQTMPGLSGIDLIREMLALRPDLPVILCTGYHGCLTLDHAEAAGAREVLRKPFGPAELAAAIRRVLGEGTPEPCLPLPWAGP